MTVDELRGYLSIFFDHKQDEDKVLVDALTKQGVDLPDAERIVALVPLAFGRERIKSLARLSMADNYSTKEKGRECFLSNEPVYGVAVALAQACKNDGSVPEDHIVAVAYRSAELTAVADALNDKVAIDGRAMLPPVFFGYQTLG